VSEQKTNRMAGLAQTYLLVLGIVALLIGAAIGLAGGTPAFFFVVGGIMLLAWLIIKAAKG